MVRIKGTEYLQTESVINSEWSTLINNNEEQSEVSIHRSAERLREDFPASSVSHVIDDRLLLQKLMAYSVKLSLSLRKKESDEPVYFKQDGKRFDKAHTVKLNQNTEYLVRVSIRPEIKLLGVVIQGERYEFEEEKKTSKTADDDISIYTLVFDTTGYDSKMKEKRKNISFSFELPRGVYLTTEFQCKFYKKSETDHCKWGQALTSADYDCHVEEGSSHVNIIKEKLL